MKSLAQISAERQFRKFCSRIQQNKHYAMNYRSVAWRRLGLREATSINPFSSIAFINRVSYSFIKDYFPEKKLVIMTRSTRSGSTPITLDQFQNPDDNSFVSDAFDTLTDAVNPSAKVITIAAEYFYVAGFAFMRSGYPKLALRCFLNSIRMCTTVAKYTHGVALALAELGHFEKSTLYLLNAADQYSEKNNYQSTADCLETAGLVLESIPGKEQISVLHNGKKINSTTCFQSARNIYAAIKHRKSSARCRILENDSKIRWSNQFIKRLIISSARAFWLYGVSPVLVIRNMLFCLLIFSFIYLFNGVSIDNQLINYTFAPHLDPFVLFNDLVQTFQFSVLAMISVVPKGWYLVPDGSSELMTLSMGAGLFLFLLWIIAICRRFFPRA